MPTPPIAESGPSLVLSPALAFLLAAVGGAIVANMYYAQPLVGVIGASLGLSPAATGLVVTVTQLGYGVGLLLVVPLGDLFENRGLILLLNACCILSLAAAALARTPGFFLAASLCIGLSSVVAQVIVPYASHLASEAVRGRLVGFLQSGMLARPSASLVAYGACWHVVFALSAVGLLAALVVLARVLPRRIPAASIGYGALLASMARLAVTTPILQRRAFYHAALFAVKSRAITTP